jgi:hypothetical protein
MAKSKSGAVRAADENTEIETASAPEAPSAPKRRRVIDGGQVMPARDSRGEPWKFTEDGYTVRGTFLGSKGVNTEFDGRARRRCIVNLAVTNDATGEKENRAVFLPEQYEKQMRKFRKGMTIEIEREDGEEEKEVYYHVFVID